MDINPVQFVRDATPYSQPDQSVGQPRPAPVSADVPKVETGDTAKFTLPAAASQQVVKVHSDNSTVPPILVYEFVDSRSDSVIVQIPSDQMISLVQEIRQRLNHAMTEHPMGGTQPGEKNDH